MRRHAITLLLAMVVALTLTPAVNASDIPPEVLANARALGIAPHELVPVPPIPGQAAGVDAYEGTRACKEWHVTSINHKISYCTNPRFESVYVRNHARLHVYYLPSPTSSWTTAPAAQTLTVNAWFIEFPASGAYYREGGKSVANRSVYDFYSGYVSINCNEQARSWIEDVSFRDYWGRPWTGPGIGAESVGSPISRRPC